MGRATPAEAARQDIASEYVRVIHAVVRGDRAVVAQITNADGYPQAYEIDTVECSRDADGWHAGSSGNGNAGFIATADGHATVVVWLDQAPAEAVAARFVLGERAETFPVEDGFVVAVFDNVPIDHDAWPTDFPSLGEWLTPKGQ